MNRMLASLGLTSALLASLMLAGTVAAQSPSAAPRVGWMQRTFSDGLKRLGLLFSDVASLASGPAAGEVWQFDSRTGRRRPIPAKTGLSWPAPSPDGVLFTPCEADRWFASPSPMARRLRSARRQTGANCLEFSLPDGIVIGLVDDDPFPHAALLAPDGKRTGPSSATNEERKRSASFCRRRAPTPTAQGSRCAIWSAAGAVATFS